MRRNIPNGCVVPALASAGMVAGADEDDLVAQQMGAGSAAELSEVQGQYKDAIKRKLEEVRGSSGPPHWCCGDWSAAAAGGAAMQRMVVSMLACISVPIHLQ